ncbi:56 kDa gametocyte antigen, related [Eimeria tenella]|uniref:56 kDa gametocyte antigen, related n=1 Tax=Eimeria tenella TaxID=5802 RepID=U6KUA4_EIMTE|nr:56 kDa gametocyte antigen, related [Eimeria tenella]CDJ41536.1 56 kDa gametocyte antigen, related [Eimeria tenella]|eukprot:XP_013232286.1 56 kDa gametocyte antigen, related [Eimeria tenella]
MTRLSLCALAVALAVGQSLAVPTTVENTVHPYSEMGTYQEGEAPGAPDESSTTTTTPSPSPEAPDQWLENFVRAVQRQLQLQESMMRQLVKEIQEYLSRAFNWDENQSAAYNRVNEMMDMITNRMTTALDGANELMATSETMDPETLRRATRKYMKEVRVQDVVVDSLWASLRGVQTSAWMSGVTAVEKEETTPMAGRAAEEFMHRMYHNLRAAGMAEEDITRFMPKTEYTTPREQTRNMGRKGRYGYGYSYGYPLYSYGYSYPSYSYSYPYYSYPSYSYPLYSYSYRYPSYSYSYPLYSYSSYSYPYYSYSYPYYSSSWYWRRLRTASCPDCPPGVNMPPTPLSPMNTPLAGTPSPTTTPMMPPMMPPMVPPTRTLGTEPLTMGMGPMPGYGYPPMMDTMPEFPPFAEGMGYPTEPINSIPTMNNMDTPFENTTNYRNLAPIDMPPFFPEAPMRPTPTPTPTPTPFGFGPVPP